MSVPHVNVSGAVFPALLLFAINALAAGAAVADKPDPPPHSPGATAHPAPSLTAQASDPTAPLIQFQVTNFYSPSVRNGQGHSNLVNLQPVVPIPANSIVPLEQVMRLTVPYERTPGPNDREGLGDISFFDLFVPKKSPVDVWGLGFTLTMPTASDSRIGSGSWQAGPAASYVYYGVSNWQIGGIAQNPASFAGEGNRESVNSFEFQPIINYLVGDWYFGAGDFNMVWDWEENEATIPIAFQAGKIQQIGKYKYNLSLELEWTAIYPDDATVPRWGIRLGVVLLLPEWAKKGHIR